MSARSSRRSDLAFHRYRGRGRRLLRGRLGPHRGRGRYQVKRLLGGLVAGSRATLLMEYASQWLYDRQDERSRAIEERLRPEMPTTALVRKAFGSSRDARRRERGAARDDDALPIRRGGRPGHCALMKTRDGSDMGRAGHRDGYGAGRR